MYGNNRHRGKRFGYRRTVPKKMIPWNATEGESSNGKSKGTVGTEWQRKRRRSLAEHCHTEDVAGDEETTSQRMGQKSSIRKKGRDRVDKPKQKRPQVPNAGYPAFANNEKAALGKSKTQTRTQHKAGGKATNTIQCNKRARETKSAGRGREVGDKIRKAGNVGPGEKRGHAKGETTRGTDW